MQYIEQICTQLLNPPKLRYSTFDLGHSILNSGRRFDFEITNNQNNILKCSLYAPKNPLPQPICIIYLHSMNGSRLQCLGYVENILNLGICLCSFDFRGCGVSSNSSISFGANQKYDVESVIRELVNIGIQRIMLWGRSMGAVAAIKYLELWTKQYQNYGGKAVQIMGCILDSPFCSLKQTILEMGTNKYKVPKFMISAGYHMIKGTIQEKGNFTIQDLQLQQSMRCILVEIPILFLASKQDSTIKHKHSQVLYDSYSSNNKRLLYISGMHNQSRDQKYISIVESFIRDQLLSLYYGQNSQKNRSHKMINLNNSYLMKQNKYFEQKSVSQCTCSIFGKNNIYKQ